MNWWHIKDNWNNQNAFVKAADKEQATVAYIDSVGVEGAFDEDLVITQIDETKVPHKWKAHV